MYYHSHNLITKNTFLTISKKPLIKDNNWNISFAPLICIVCNMGNYNYMFQVYKWLQIVSIRIRSLCSTIIVSNYCLMPKISMYISIYFINKESTTDKRNHAGTLSMLIEYITECWVCKSNGLDIFAISDIFFIFGCTTWNTVAKA